MKKWSIEDHYKKLQSEVILGKFSESFLFGTHVDIINQKLKADRPQGIKPEEEEKVSKIYNQVFLSKGQRIRYSFIPAQKESRGLVVLFHAWNGYQYVDHIKGWPCFDVLAPFDDFGPNRWSCGYWGLNGDPFLVEPLQELILETVKRRGYTHWFTMGGSLGGFGALYHGIKGNCSGIYAMTPQIDIRAMSEQDLKKGYTDDVYTPMISKNSPDRDPNVIDLAEKQEELPPLFLIQGQYDTINPFERHGYLLQKVYHQKKAWYGLRIHPAIGHRADGSQSEAEYFFLLIQKRNAPKTFKFL